MYEIISTLKYPIMKKLISAIFTLTLMVFSISSFAQEDPKPKSDKKETEEIIIRKKGDKDVSISLQITGDKVIVNGKPLVEFNDSSLTINKRKIIIRGDNFSNILGDMEEDFDFSFGESNSPFLGVTTEETKEGAEIKSISKGSAAEIAGLKEDDIITQINNTNIKDPETLAEEIKKYKAGDKIKIHYNRNGMQNVAEATLKEKKNWTKFSYSGPNGGSKTFTFPRPPAPPLPPGTNRKKQIELFDDSDFDFNMFPPKQKLGIKIQDTKDASGVKIIEVNENSAAAKAGLKEEDIITEIGGKKLTNTDEARELLNDNKDKEAYKIKALRNGSQMNFNIKIEKKLKTADL